MQLLPSINAASLALGSVSSNELVGVTIGNFDGMHSGHKQLFNTLEVGLAELGLRKSQPVRKVLVTFFPHPRQVLQGYSRAEINDHPELWELTSLRMKFQLAREFGFDYFYAIRFSEDFSTTSADEFLKRYMCGALNAQLLVVGYDWAFGKGREGIAANLASLAAPYSIKVSVVEPVEIDGVRVSTSAIKLALRAGDVQAANKLLGRRFGLTSRVLRGDSRGHQLGFPTANMAFARQVLPKNGVYVTLSRVDERNFPSVTNVGVRPTFNGTERLVETHIISENTHELHGKRLEIEFISRIRDEKKFSGVEELKRAISKDREQALEVATQVLRNEH